MKEGLGAWLSPKKSCYPAFLSSSFHSIHSSVQTSILSQPERDNRPIMTKITDLTDDTLQYIFSKRLNNSALAKMILVSHRFKMLTEPILYRNIHLDAEPVEERSPGSFPFLKWTDQLIASLKARPELGRYTTALSLRVPSRYWYDSQPQISIIRRMPELCRLSYDPPAVDGKALPPGCKNLTDLRFNFSHVTNHYDNDSSSWMETGIPLEIIAKNLWHPSLRKLQAENVFFTKEFDYRRWLIERRMLHGRSRVDDIRFLDCFPRIEYPVLRALIISVRHLKCFAFEITTPKQSLTAPNDPPCKIDFRPVLGPNNTTIEELALSSSDHPLDLVKFSGSFLEWGALKRLAVPFSRDVFRHTTLHQVLPPQLEELQLEKRLWTSSTPEITLDYKIILGDDLSPLWELAKRKPVCVPGLKRLIWWLQYPTGMKFDKARYRFYVSTVELSAQENFTDAGVKFELVETPFFKETPFGKRLYKW